MKCCSASRSRPDLPVSNCHPDRLCGSLCDAVLDNTDLTPGKQVLEQLEAAKPVHDASG